MSKKNLFYEIFDIVMSETEVEKEQLLSSLAKTRDVVDARYILVYYLHSFAGFDAAYISKMLGMTPQGVRLIVTNYDNRKEQAGKFFEITVERIRKRLENTSLLSL